MSMKTFLRRWRFTLILLAAVVAGSLIGYFAGPEAKVLKPLGDVVVVKRS